MSQDEPDPLGEQLLAMKERSQLILDLAYSALLSNNRRLARAVVDFEDWMDRQQFKLQRQALANLASTNIDKVLTIIRLAEALELIGDSARKIADVILRDVEPHPVLQLATEEADATLFHLLVAPDAPISKATLGELSLASETGARIIAIQRGEDWIIGPDSDVKIQTDDLLFARGPSESCRLLDKMGAKYMEKD